MEGVSIQTIAGFAVHGALEARRIGAIEMVERDLQARAELGQPGERAEVDRALHDDCLAAPERAEQRRDRGHPRGEHQGVGAALERAQHRFDLRVARAVVPPVGVGRVEERVSFVASEGGRRLDRRHEAAGRRVDVVAELGQHRGGLRWVTQASRVRSGATVNAPRFRLLPKRLHLVERGVLEAAPAARSASSIAKAALELGVGLAQRRLAVHVQVARQIDRREQQIADLVAQPLGARILLELGADLGDLLVELVEHLRRLRPVEADPRRAPLQLGRAHERRERERHVVQDPHDRRPPLPLCLPAPRP